MIRDISHWLRPHLHAISLGMVATLLVIYGNDINLWVRKHVRKYHFFVRLIVFVLVCTAGYGVATVMLTKFLAGVLGSISDYYLAIVIALVFLMLGLVAEERKQL